MTSKDRKKGRHLLCVAELETKMMVCDGSNNSKLMCKTGVLLFLCLFQNKVEAFSSPSFNEYNVFSVSTTSSLHRFETRLWSTSTEGSNNSNNSLRPGSLAAATAEQGRVPYGESSRKYRRTVFGHEDWVDHRSSDRFIQNLQSMFYSGIVRQIQKEVAIVTLVGMFVVFWNTILTSLLDLPLLSLPSLPFTLSSPALGLLLVFRTNASYGRWLEARKAWARIISQSCNLIRMAATFVDTSTDREALDHLVRVSWAFPRCLMNQLSVPEEDEEVFQQEIFKVFDKEQDCDFVERILSSNKDNRPVIAMMELSLALDNIPIDEKRRVEIDKSLVIMGDLMTACQRIFTSPVPLVYTRHTARFLTLWMLLLPFGLYNIFDSVTKWILIPAIAVLAIFLFGIEELSVQLEEPFTILPMNKFCNDIQRAGETMLKVSLETKTTRRRKQQKHQPNLPLEEGREEGSL